MQGTSKNNADVLAVNWTNFQLPALREVSAATLRAEERMRQSPAQTLPSSPVRSRYNVSPLLTEAVSAPR